MLRVSYDLHGALEAIQLLEQTVGDELPKGLWDVAKDIAQEARRDHPYQNRTGNLEASTEASETAGSFYDGTLIVSVDAWMSYASYVEDNGFTFLEPAWNESTAAVEQIMNWSLEHAIDRAGWSR